MANKETEQPIFVNRDLSIPSAEYKKWIGELTKRYKQSQVKAAIKVNEGMLPIMIVSTMLAVVDNKF